MLAIEEMKHLRYVRLKESHKEYDFGSFLMALRSECGYSRERVSLETGINPSKLGRIETGQFKRSIPEHTLILLCKYYQFDFSLMKKKMKDFLISRKKDEEMHNM